MCFLPQGTSHQPGVNQRTMAELFAVAEDRSPHWQYHLHLSMVEVYRERVYDLMGEESMVEGQIKLGNEGNHLAGVKWIHVKNTEEAIRVRGVVGVAGLGGVGWDIFSALLLTGLYIRVCVCVCVCVCRCSSVARKGVLLLPQP